MKKIIVLAGNREQFERYLDDNGLTDTEAVYGYARDVMLGIEASIVVKVGTWYKKKKAYELEQEAKSRVRPPISHPYATEH